MSSTDSTGEGPTNTNSSPVKSKSNSAKNKSNQLYRSSEDDEDEKYRASVAKDDDDQSDASSIESESLNGEEEGDLTPPAPGWKMATFESKYDSPNKLQVIDKTMSSQERTNEVSDSTANDFGARVNDSRLIKSKIRR